MTSVLFGVVLKRFSPAPALGLPKGPPAQFQPGALLVPWAPLCTGCHWARWQDAPPESGTSDGTGRAPWGGGRSCGSPYAQEQLEEGIWMQVGPRQKKSQSLCILWALRVSGKRCHDFELFRVPEFNNLVNLGE